jgi:two-component system CheB/CheR fusion protein
LSSIIATTKYLKDNFERMKPETVKEMLELVYDSSIAELNMLDSLVDWARIKYASEIFSPTKVKLSKYVDQTFDMLKEIANVNEINFHNKLMKTKFCRSENVTFFYKT